MPRLVMFLAMLFVGLGSIAHGEELSKNDAMKAWASFVEKWKVTMPDGNTMTVTTTRSPSKPCFIHHGEDFTAVVGWDPGKKSLKSVGFVVDGSQVISHFKVVGDARADIRRGYSSVACRAIIACSACQPASSLGVRVGRLIGRVGTLPVDVRGVR